MGGVVLYLALRKGILHLLLCNKNDICIALSIMQNDYNMLQSGSERL